MLEFLIEHDKKSEKIIRTYLVKKLLVGAKPCNSEYFMNSMFQFKEHVVSPEEKAHALEYARANQLPPTFDVLNAILREAYKGNLDITQKGDKQI